MLHAASCSWEQHLHRAPHACIAPLFVPCRVSVTLPGGCDGTSARVDKCKDHDCSPETGGIGVEVGEMSPRRQCLVGRGSNLFEQGGCLSPASAHVGT